MTVGEPHRNTARVNSTIHAWCVTAAGAVMIVVGFRLIPWAGAWLTPDGTIDTPVLRSGLLALSGVSIVVGVFLMLKRRTIELAKLILVVASLSIGALMITLTCQVVCSPAAPRSGWRATRHVPLELNQLGYRGHPIEYSDDDRVILLLGDSHVEALACAFDYMPERRLEHHLKTAGKRVKVFSLAAGGYGQDQQLLALPEYFAKYRADLVILWQTPINDIWNNTWPAHWPTNVGPKPTFWLEGSELRGPTEKLGAPVDLPRLKILATLAPYLPSVRRRDSLWESRLPPPYEPMTSYSGPVETIWQQYWDGDTGSIGSIRTENLASEKSHLAIRLSPRSKRTEYSIGLTNRLLKEIEGLARRNRSDFMIVNIDAATSPEHYRDGVYALNGKYYRISESQFQQNMSDVNRGFDVETVQVSLEQWRVGPDDPHFNEHATDEAMMRLASAIGQRF